MKLNSSPFGVVGIRVQKDQLWSVVQGSLREKLGAQNFEIWIRPIQLGSIQEESVSLEVPNRYYRDWVAANYGPALNKELEKVIGRPIRLQFHVATKSTDPKPEQAQASATPHALEYDAIPGVSPDKTVKTS